MVDSTQKLGSSDEDLCSLAEQGTVEVRGWGRSLSRIQGAFQNKTKEKVRVRVNPGTFFRATGSHQNMVARRPVNFTLEPEERRHVDIEASCIDAHLAVPTSNDAFLGVSRVNPDVMQLLETYFDKDPMAIQVGVWALTDKLTSDQIFMRVRRTDEFGREAQAIQPSHVEMAINMLNNLGLKHQL